MRDEVLKHLYSCDPGLSLVGYTGLATNTHDHLVVVHAVDQVLQGVGEYFGIGINLDTFLSVTIPRTTREHAP